jgi:hypothetical protein
MFSIKRMSGLPLEHELVLMPHAGRDCYSTNPLALGRPYWTRVVRDMAQSDLADEYEVVEFPAILEIEKRKVEGGDKRQIVTKITEKPLWPEFFNLDALYRTKASMPLFQWNAQYQQKPTAEEAAMVKREWWQGVEAGRPA